MSVLEDTHISGLGLQPPEVERALLAVQTAAHRQVEDDRRAVDDRRKDRGRRDQLQQRGARQLSIATTAMAR